MEKAEELVHVWNRRTRGTQDTNASVPLIQSHARGIFGTILSSALVLCFLPRDAERGHCLRYPVEFTGFSARWTFVIWHCFKDRNRRQVNSGQNKSVSEFQLLVPSWSRWRVWFSVNLSDSERYIVNRGGGEKNFKTLSNHSVQSKNSSELIHFSVVL